MPVNCQIMSLLQVCIIFNDLFLFSAAVPRRIFSEIFVWPALEGSSSTSRRPLPKFDILFQNLKRFIRSNIFTSYWSLISSWSMKIIYRHKTWLPYHVIHYGKIWPKLKLDEVIRHLHNRSTVGSIGQPDISRGWDWPVLPEMQSIWNIRKWRAQIHYCFGRLFVLFLFKTQFSTAWHVLVLSCHEQLWKYDPNNKAQERKG